MGEFSALYAWCFRLFALWCYAQTFEMPKALEHRCMKCYKQHKMAWQPTDGDCMSHYYWSTCYAIKQKTHIKSIQASVLLAVKCVQ